MSLDNYSREELDKLSMIELARIILEEEKKAINFKDIFKQIADVKGVSGENQDDSLAQFYTDLNVDGRFLTLGSDMWGLKRWYPVEQIDEDVHTAPKKKKKKTKKKKETAEKAPDIEAEDLDIVDGDVKDIINDFDDEDDEDFDDIDDDFDDFDEDEDFDDDDFDDDDEVNDEEEEK